MHTTQISLSLLLLILTLTRVVNCPAFTWTVQELAHSVQHPGKGRFCPGMFLKFSRTIQSQ